MLSAASVVHTPHLNIELVTDTEAIAPGKAVTLALRIRHEPGWHTYWKNPGDSGMATAVRWSVPDGYRVAPLLWPVPKRLPVGPLTNFGYEGEVFLLSQLEASADASSRRPVDVVADVDWLVCKDICIPGSARLSLALPQKSEAMQNSRSRAAALERARNELPQPLAGWSVQASQRNDAIVIVLEPAHGSEQEITRLTFFPDEDGIIENASEQTLERRGNRYQLTVQASQGLGSRARLSGLLVAEPRWLRSSSAAEVAIPVVSDGGGTDPISLAVALVCAFVGGLILNLMPCVFPVVSIKVLGFVEQAHGERRALRVHGLAFASGVVTCFWALAFTLIAFRTTGSHLGWGYQLQSPSVIAALALLFFALGLNMSGVFELGATVQRLGGISGAKGYRGSFFSGLLATVVATPCTAPFMGAALGFALAQPAGIALLVFTVLALGMALPYVVLSLAPQWVRWLPRPGRWMQTLKQLLAFPLYLTVVWLSWVLATQAGAGAAAYLSLGLVLLAAAAWTWGRFGGAAAVTYRTRLIGGIAAVFLSVAAAIVALPAPVAPSHTAAQSPWLPFSEEELARARSEGRWAFVDFTAAWCVTCQVNKQLVLNTDAVTRRFVEKRVVLMRADWTSRDTRIGAALRRLGRSGVPVYALYPPTGGPPQLLPEILTHEMVLAALEAAEPI
jgi:thiol:disulfide interchange protein DsbD